MSSRVIHIVCVQMSFLSEAKWYSIVWMDHTVFSHISFKRWIDGEVFLFGSCELFLLQALEGNINTHGNEATKGCRKGSMIRPEFQS